MSPSFAWRSPRFNPRFPHLGVCLDPGTRCLGVARVVGIVHLAVLPEEVGQARLIERHRTGKCCRRGPRHRFEVFRMILRDGLNGEVTVHAPSRILRCLFRACLGSLRKRDTRELAQILHVEEI